MDSSSKSYLREGQLYDVIKDFQDKGQLYDVIKDIQDKNEGAKTAGFTSNPNQKPRFGSRTNYQNLNKNVDSMCDKHS